MPRLILTIGAFLLVSQQAFGDFLFTENFDGYLEGSKANQNNKATASSPVLWTDEAYTSIVAMEKTRGLIGLEGVTIKTNPKVATNSIVRSGGSPSALLFNYKEGPNSWSEQRFDINQAVLGKKGLSEMWIQYDLFIPGNYRTVDAYPHYDGTFGGGHKILALYADSYDSTNMIFGQLFARKDLNGLPGYDGNAYNNSTLTTFKNDKRIYTQFEIDTSRKRAWIFIDRDLGKWQRRTIRFKFPTSDMSNDGVVQVWIQRADGDVSTLVDRSDGSFYGYNQNYFNAGYFNGWSNDGFDDQTYFVLDNVIITDNPENIDSSAITKPNAPNAPNAPVNPIRR